MRSTLTNLTILLTGSVAALTMVGTANAADLPAGWVKAKRVEYVSICGAYGPGFFEIPGTGICTKIFGDVQADMGFTSPRRGLFLTQSKGSAHYSATELLPSRSDSLGFQLSGKPGMDLRAQTEYGTLRTVLQLRIDLQQGLAAGIGNAGEPSQKPQCYRCYVEWGGFTVGRLGSTFPYFSEDDVLSALVDAKESGETVKYTAEISKGWTITAAIEDPNPHVAKGAFGSTLAGLDGVNGGVASAIGPQKYWDLIGMTKYEQDWGGVQFAAAAHNISVQATGPGGLGGPACSVAIPGLACAQTGVTTNNWGFAVLGGITYNLPQIAKGDLVVLEGIYGDGALEYVGVNGTQGNMSSLDFPGLNTGGFLRDDHDAIQIANGTGGFTNEKERAASFQFDARHYLTDCSVATRCFRTNLLAGYAWVNPGDVTRNTSWTLGGLGNAESLHIGGNLIWGVKRKTAEIGVEVMYEKTRQDIPGLAAAPLPPGISKDPGNVAARFVVDRQW